MTSKLSGPMLAPANGGTPDSAVVLLHGYGSDGNDLIGLAPHWQDVLPGALIVSPNAPEALGMGGYQWFAIDWAGDRVASRQLGLIAAQPVLSGFLDDLWEQTGIPPERTILAGFSQGAMMALHVGLSLEKRVMGIIAFSGALVLPAGFDANSAKPPVCLVHGDLDEVVDPNSSADADRILRDAGLAVSYHVSRGVGHGIAPDGLAFATDFIAGLTDK